jgi:serine protease Do
LTLYREGREIQIEVIIGEQLHGQPTEESPGHEVDWLGMELIDLDIGLAKRLGLPIAAQGVVVTEVLPGSPAETGGVQAGDVIREVNRRRISSASDFEANLGKAGRSTLVLLVNREGNDVYLVLEKGRK